MAADCVHSSQRCPVLLVFHKSCRYISTTSIQVTGQLALTSFGPSVAVKRDVCVFLQFNVYFLPESVWLMTLMFKILAAAGTFVGNRILLSTLTRLLS